MMRNIIVALALLTSLSGFAKSLKNTRPNIIFVMTDDQGSNLSWMGHPILKTPNIDKFADESVYFSEFHVSPTCAPCRSALMTGRHEFKNGVTHTIYRRELMDIKATTFPQLLQKAGYKTGMFGKWHLGDEDGYLPSQRGFDEVLMHGSGGIGQQHDGGGSDFPPNAIRETRYFDNVLLHNQTVVQTKGYCTDVFFQSALSWMKQQHDAKQPFFTYIATNTPHSPLIAPKENYDRLAKRHPNLKPSGRFAMIENIDDNFGIMMKQLKEWDMLENTLIVFTTDNGAPYKPGSDAFNGGYKTGKGSPYEGGTHVPAFWYWKDKLPQGDTVKALTAHVDIFKTMCDLAGVKIPKSVQEMDGRTLLPLLEKQNKAKWDDRKLFIHCGRWNAGDEPNSESQWAVRTTRWRLVEGELYDISNDPYEKTNVADDYPDVVNELSKSYQKWWKEVLPMMINEDKYKEFHNPMVEMYNKQKAEIGIPNWMPN